MASLGLRKAWNTLTGWDVSTSGGGSAMLSAGVVTFAGSTYTSGAVMTDTLSTSLTDGESFYFRVEAPTNDFWAYIRLYTVDSGDRVWLAFRKIDSTVLLNRRVSGTTTSSAALTWDRTANPWVKLTRSGGNLVMSVSSDGLSWSSVGGGSLAAPSGGGTDFDWTNLTLELSVVVQAAGASSVGFSRLNGGPSAVVATKIGITTPPASTLDVGDNATIVAAAQDATDATQDDYTAGTWRVRARSAPTGWDLTTVLASGAPAAGVKSFTFMVPMAGEWTFGVDDEGDLLTDSLASNAVTASLPSGGGGTTLSAGLPEMDLLKGGSAQRRTLLYWADATGLTGKPNISVNGGTPSTTPAASDAVNIGGNAYEVVIADGSIAAGDRVQVITHAAATVVSAVGRVTLTDVGLATASTGDIADAVVAEADIQAIKTAAEASSKPGDAMTLTSGALTAAATELLDLADGVETGVTVRKTLRAALSALAAKITGAETTTVRARNIADTKNRITATVDEHGNRTAVTLDLD